MNKQGGNIDFIKLFMILGVLISGIFYFGAIVQANSDSLRINEIAWMGTEYSSSDEWIELYNPGSVVIDLSGWTLVAQDGSPEIELSGFVDVNSYYLLERTDDFSVDDVEAQLIYTGALGNTGEYLILKNSSGEIIDEINASTAWSSGDNDTKQTMSLNSGGVWVTSDDVGGTPGQENIINNSNNESNQEEDNSSNDLEQSEENEATSTDNQVVREENGENTKIKSSDEEINFSGIVVINEIVSDPIDGENEWVELFNTSIEDIDLSGWFLEEGSGAKTSLTGTIGRSGSERFLVIEKLKGNLNNTGDIVILRDSSGVYIDSLCYGDWSDEDPSDNAIVAKDPFSLARIEDGRNTGNDSVDFCVTSQVTKGKSNVISEDELKTSADIKNAIFISEIYPDPDGVDADREYIELYNRSEEAINLYGWQLGDESEYNYRIERDLYIDSHDYLVFFKDETNLALNNSGDTVYLFQIDKKKAIDSLNYKNSSEGMSLNCLTKDLELLGVLPNLDCSWSTNLTPGETNEIELPNREPIPDFSVVENLFVGMPVIFDSSDTIDPDQDELKYFWDFDDGFYSEFPNPDHIFGKSGKYLVTLVVNDGEFDKQIEKELVVFDWSLDLSQATSADLQIDFSDIKIDEFLPNPVGSDQEGEYIKLFNSSENDINLLNWSVDDMEGGSRPYKFTDNVFLKAGEYYNLSREDSGIALNNFDDEVRLIAPNGEVIDFQEYGKTKEGEVYGPSNLNKILVDSSVSEKKGGSVFLAQGTSQFELKNNINIKDLNQEYLSKKIAIQGIVSSLPGELSSQYFYISDDSLGLQIYSYYKDFPDLEIGDLIEVNGEVSKTGSELRVKTKEASNIQVIKNGLELKTQKCNCSEIDKIQEASLAQVEAEIIDIQTDKVYLGDESGETQVYLKNASNDFLSSFSLGDRVLARGIVQNSSSGRRLQLRNENEIELIERGDNEGQVLGESIEKKEWTLKKRKDNRLKIYGLIIVGVIFLVAFIYLIRFLFFKNV